MTGQGQTLIRENEDDNLVIPFRHVATRCPHCRKMFAHPRSVGRKFCSKHCWYTFPNKPPGGNTGRKLSEEQKERIGQASKKSWADPVIRQRILDSRPSRKGEKNGSWKGDAVSYEGGHARVRKARGTPNVCVMCGKTDPTKRYEWANVTGDFKNVDDYIRLCVPCHRAWDATRVPRGICLDCGSSHIGMVDFRGNRRRGAQWMDT